MTMMACPEAVMRLEQDLMMALEGATSYEIDSDGLWINFGLGTIRFTAGP
jgi:heat shock protein HslJ